MIKIENTEIFGWEAAIRGMRNPKNSWDKSDSYWGLLEDESPINPSDEPFFFVGENDRELMSRLINAGKDHRKVIRYIDVYVDITAPLYWWKEFKTYRKDRKFLDDEDFYDYDDYEIEEFIEMNSCSTMHKIHDKEFTLDDFSHEHLLDSSKECEFFPQFFDCLEHTIQVLNFARKRYLETKDKYFWWQLIQLLPSSYNQKRTVKLNYEVLLRMYKSRKGHKLDEWQDFCKWIESLPYSELITGNK